VIRKYFNRSGFRQLLSNINFGNQGFTVAEFLVASALLSVMLAGMIKFFTVINQFYTTQNAAAYVQQVVRYGIDIMTQNIRMVGFNPLSLSDVGIMDDFSQESIHFTFDLNSNGTIDDDEDIRFLLDDHTLKRQQSEGNRITLIENVTDLSFTYLDVNDQITNNRAEIRSVVVSMTVSEPAGNGQSISRTYSTRVICRNLGL